MNILGRGEINAKILLKMKKNFKSYIQYAYIQYNLQLYKFILISYFGIKNSE